MRRPAPAIHGAEPLRHNALVTEATDFAEYNRAVFLEVLIEDDQIYVSRLCFFAIKSFAAWLLGDSRAAACAAKFHSCPLK
jgi:hypothetical protein